MYVDYANIYTYMRKAPCGAEIFGILYVEQMRFA